MQCNFVKALHAMLYCFVVDFTQENECFQDALRSAQKRLLAVTRDRTFLMDRLLLYEKVDNSSSESEDTDSSEDEVVKVEPSKKYVHSNIHKLSNARYLKLLLNVHILIVPEEK